MARSCVAGVAGSRPGAAVAPSSSSGIINECAPAAALMVTCWTRTRARDATDCVVRHGCIRRARARTLKLNSCAMMMEFAVLMSLRSVKWCMLAGADGARQNRAKVSGQGRCRRRPPAEVRMCLCPFVTRGVFRDYRRWSFGGPGITLAVHTPGDIVLHWNRIRTGELGRMENVL